MHRTSRRAPLLTALAGLALLAACGKEPPKPAPPPLEVTTLKVEARDVPVSVEYVAQTQSSQAVNIQARVSGFLDKRVYTEGAVVKAGQVLFRMDPKPFQAQVDGAAAALQRNQAALDVATANLKRVEPLVQKNALSQKDLDDAKGQYEQAGAAVAQSKAQLATAKLDLSYTIITSPVDGVTSYAAIADGSYVSPPNSQLTTVSVLSPMWVNFSLSENELQRIRNDVRAGRLKLPPDLNMTVQIEQADGSLFPFTGRITFADPSFNPQTGTFLIRAAVDNPKGVLRPNQYVRARLKGAIRPNAILVPQRAVQQGGKGHFVWIIDAEGKAQLRPVTVGEWYGDGWFIDEGLHAGDQLVIDGAQRLAAGAAPKVTAFVPRAELPPPSAAAPAASIRVQFDSGQATLGAEAQQLLQRAAQGMQGQTGMIDITGHTDRSGSRDANVELAKRRALAVRDALVAAGVSAERLRLKPPQDVVGSGSDADARRVEITPGS
ncbi:MAG TPA: efflux RND transporter periplasmic adaptor subunit [Rubrivivax sp.]|nr:efflux RND transporter periplasmic adaptor subunit [Rubrivivax sp.]HRY88124.1 efflux RND transporter periplasmic adaptor subunit [Rubrivivax sp.]HRZ62365.1 efflux RND transporter periplasmic adaptor subunit [Rubrivivax sp.]